VHKFAVSRGPDETRGFKLLHVVGECRWADSYEFAHRRAGRRILTVPQLSEDFVAARVRKSTSNQMHLFFGEFDGLSGRGHADWMCGPVLRRCLPGQIKLSDLEIAGLRDFEVACMPLHDEDRNSGAFEKAGFIGADKLIGCGL
jgi:hypothetical protein